MTVSTIARLAATSLALTMLIAPTHASAVDESPLAVAEARATALIEQGRPDAALEIWARTIEQRLAASELAGSASTATVLERAARALEALERFAEAEPYLRQALELRQQLHGEAHATVDVLTRRLATAIAELRPDDPEAGELLEQRARVRPEAESLQDLALRRLGEGRLDEAVDLMLRAEAAAASDPSRRGWRRAAIAADLAGLYERLGRDALAEQALRRAVDARRAESGQQHPAIVGTMTALADHLIEHERWNEAETVLRDAFDVRRAAYGSCGPCSRDVTGRLARVYGALGRDVDFCLSDTADSIVKADGDGADDLDAGARRALRRGELVDALELARRAVDDLEAVHGAESIELLSPLALVARVERRLKRNGDELTTLERMVAIAGAFEGARPASLAGALSRLASAAQRSGDTGRAMELVLREHGIREALGQTMPRSAAAARLARLSRAAGDERAAATWFLEAADDWEQMAGRDAREYVTNRVELASSYAALGLDTDAAVALGDLLERETARATPRADLQIRILGALEPLTRALGDESRADVQAAELARLRATQRGR